MILVVLNIYIFFILKGMLALIDIRFGINFTLLAF